MGKLFILSKGGPNPDLIEKFCLVRKESKETKPRGDVEEEMHLQRSNDDIVNASPPKQYTFSLRNKKVNF